MNIKTISRLIQLKLSPFRLHHRDSQSLGTPPKFSVILIIISPASLCGQDAHQHFNHVFFTSASATRRLPSCPNLNFMLLKPRLSFFHTCTFFQSDSITVCSLTFFLLLSTSFDYYIFCSFLTSSFSQVLGKVRPLACLITSFPPLTDSLPISLSLYHSLFAPILLSQVVGKSWSGCMLFISF